MPIIITVVVLLALLGILFYSQTIRDTIIDAGAAAGLWVAGVWGRRPTRTQVWAYIRIPVFILLGVFLLTVALFTGIGFYVNAPLSGFLIGALLPFWCLMRMLRQLPWLAGRFFRWIFMTTWGIISVILLIAVVNFLLGVWSPEVKQSVERWTENKKLELSEGINKSSRQTEPEMGTFATINQNTAISNDSNIPFKEIEKGLIVRVLKGYEKKATTDSEGMSKVMLPDRFGRYVESYAGWVPTRVLDWEWKKKEPKKEPEVKVEPTMVPLAPVAPADKQQMSGPVILEPRSEPYVYIISMYQKTPRLLIPKGCQYDIIRKGDGSFAIHFENGMSFDTTEGVIKPLPQICGTPFQIEARGPQQRIEIFVKRR